MFPALFQPRHLQVICASFSCLLCVFSCLFRDFYRTLQAIPGLLQAIIRPFPGHSTASSRHFASFSGHLQDILRTFTGHPLIFGNRVFARYALCPTFSRRENDKAHLVRGRPLRPRLYTAGFARDISQVTLRKKPRTFLCMAFKYLIPFLYFAKAVRLPSRFNQCHTASRNHTRGSSDLITLQYL